MYRDSEKFIELMHSEIVRPVVRGVIGTQPFTHADIARGSFTCSNQCANGNDIKLGSVYIGELDFTLLKSSATTRGGWVGKTISIDIGLADDEREYYIPLGLYEVASANWMDDGLHIIAYDGMTKLDKNFVDNLRSGTAYEWLSYICNKCKVGLGNTAEEIAAMPNGTEPMAFKSLDSVETYRDALHWLAITLCGFATFDRLGRLVIRRFTSDVVDAIPASHRYGGAQFSDYTTRYTGISFIDDDDTTDYIHVNPDNGLTMNLGDNPLVKFGTAETQSKMRHAVLDGLQEFSGKPFYVQTLLSAAYDLGDKISFTGGVAGELSSGYIMEYSFTLTEYTMRGYGNNPALQSAKSKADKDISGLRRKVKAEQLAIQSFVNKKLIELRPTSQVISEINFAVPSDQTVLYHGVAKLHLNSGGLVRFLYILNGSMMAFTHEAQVKETVDTVTLFIPIEAKGNTPQSFTILIESDNADGYCEALDNQNALIAYGLVSSEWSGNLILSDDMAYVRVGTYSLDEMLEEVAVTQQIPSKLTFDVLKSFDGKGTYKVRAMSEEVRIIIESDVFTRYTEDGKVRTLEGTNTTRKTYGGLSNG